MDAKRGRGNGAKRAEAMLDRALLEPDPWLVIARALGTAIPSLGGMVYDWRTPQEVGRIVSSFHVDDSALQAARTHLPRLAAYRRDAEERRPGEPRTLSQIFRARGERLGELRARIFEPAGIQDHVRAILWDRGRILAWSGVFGERGRRFDDDDRATLRALVPRVRAVIETHRAIGNGREAVGLIDVLPDPAYLVNAHGMVAHANDAARRLWSSPPAWIRRPVDAIDPSLAHTITIRAGGLPLWLVLPRRTKRACESGLALPPVLAEVADALARGLTDKEIAERHQRPLATVRTYVQRLHTRLGVGHRVAAARILWRAGYGEDETRALEPKGSS